jgi:undecaprenyl-diphosphatase
MGNGLISALLIAIVQGITEWLPVSSSGHLVLAEKLLGYSDGGLIFDVALHFGTLMAVFVYFGQDIMNILEDLLRGKWNSENGKTGLLLIVASIPVAIVGFAFREYFEAVFSSIGVIALGFGITGIFLFIASIDLRGLKRKSVGFLDAVFMGVVQTFALLPGISRSGSTISAGLLSGLEQKKAVRFAFLMAIPVIFGANIVGIGSGKIPSEMIWATIVSFVVGLATIHLLVRYVLTSRKSLRWFALYCLILATALGVWILL